MLRLVHVSGSLGALVPRLQVPVIHKLAAASQIAELSSTCVLRKRLKKEWTQDQSQREVDAILESTKLSGPIKNPLKLLTFNDEELGTMKFHEAKKLSEEKQLKLVPIDGKSNPMIYKLMDGKQMLEYNRQNKKRRKKPLKKLIFSLTTNEHDLEMKVKHATEWLKHGHVVDVEVKSKSFANDPDIGQMQGDIFKKLTDMFKDHATVHRSTRTDHSLRIVLVHIEDETEH